MKVGDKVEYVKSYDKNVIQEWFTIGKEYEVIEVDKDGDVYVIDNNNERSLMLLKELKVVKESEEKQDKHYNNENGSLYLFAQHHDLNAWEFEVIKRIVRCRKKGEFISDIDKTKRVLDLYLKEQGELYKNQVEVLNNK